MDLIEHYKSNRDQTKGSDSLCVAYTFRAAHAKDIITLRKSIQKSATVANSFAILLTGNPLQACEAPDWKEHEALFNKDDIAWFRACSEGDIEQIRKATAGWVASVAAKTAGNMASTVEAGVYQGAMDEELERGQTLSLTAKLEPDWVLLLDQDEILEGRASRRLMERLMSHPDPSVTAWGFSWATHWDSEELCRVDSPWGDDGEYRGQNGSVKMFRTKPLSDEQIAKECSIRTRSYSMVRQQDRIHQYMKAREISPSANHNYMLDDEGMIMCKFVEHNGIGLHVLAYEKEDPQDYVRLFDQLYGIVDDIVIVWTGDKDGISDSMMDVVDLYDATLIKVPLDKHLANARNAGIDYLESKGCAWALFFDPDEVCEDWQQMARHVRRMAEISNSWGWMVKFDNVQRDGQSSESETLRMTRVDGNGTMRMNGRIHEGFGNSLNAIRDAGVHPRIRYAPFKMVNTGQAMSDEQVQAKLEKYTDLLLEEIKHDTDCVQAWVALGLQCENDGSINDAVRCYENGVKCSGNSYLPHRELGSYHMREAKRYFSNVLDRISSAHGSYDATKKLVEVLEQIAPERPLLGASKGLKEKGLPLPGISFEIPDFKV